MKEPTIDERKRWWLLCYAITSMEKAKATCDLIQSNCDGAVTPTFEAFALAAHTYYARPFVRSFGVGRLEDDIVPGERRGIHAWLTDLRSRTMAHTDSTTHEIAGMPMNDVVYYQQSGRNFFATLLSVSPVSAYSDASVHCTAMIEVFKGHLRRFHDDFGHLIPTSGGQHLLSLEPGTPTFIEGHTTPDSSFLQYK